jgi:hypothetical protein
MCRRETSTAAVSGRDERGNGGRGRSYTLQEFLDDGGGQFPEKTVTAKTKASPKFTNKKIKTRTERRLQAASLSKSFYD